MPVFDEDKNQNVQGSAAIVDLTAANGTASDTIPTVGAAFNQTTLDNIVKSLAVKINAINAQLRDGSIIPLD